MLIIILVQVKQNLKRLLVIINIIFHLELLMNQKRLICIVKKLVMKRWKFTMDHLLYQEQVCVFNIMLRLSQEQIAILQEQYLLR